jgi:hypothetical protein
MATLPTMTLCDDISINNYQTISEFVVYDTNQTSIYSVSYNNLLHLIHVAIIPNMSFNNYNIEDYYVSHPNLSTDDITLSEIFLSLNIDMIEFQIENFVCNDAPDTHPSNYIDTPISSSKYASFDVVNNNVY